MSDLLHVVAFMEKPEASQEEMKGYQEIMEAIQEKLKDNQEKMDTIPETVDARGGGG
jgi:membrane protein insertase Oxa1/YidC/SpoIIIJ